MTEISQEAAGALAKALYEEAMVETIDEGLHVPGSDVEPEGVWDGEHEPIKKLFRHRASRALTQALPAIQAQVLAGVKEQLLSDEVLAQMAEIFMWAVTTGPSHPDATPEKAIEQIIKPIRSKLATLNPSEGEGMLKPGMPGHPATETDETALDQEGNG